VAIVQVQDLIEAGVHFGHRASRWNPKMRPYIYGKRNLIHIIDLRETVRGLLRAAKFVSKVASRGSLVLFVGTKRQAKEAIEREAQRCGMPYVSQRWLGGMLTNFKTIRQSIKRLRDLEEITGAGTSTEFTKKEMLKLARERDKLERALGGIKQMDALPDAVFIIDVGHEEIAVREAKKLSVPVVAIVDTNCSPEGIDYPIPGNDDAMRAIQLYAEGIADAVLDGKASIPEVPRGDDEFVELDEEGKPKVEQKAAKKAPTKKRARVTKIRSKGRGRAQPEEAPAAGDATVEGASAGGEEDAE
jgi:small subunit ribosomal protein S2